MDSVPPLRLQAYERLRELAARSPGAEESTGDIAEALGLPTSTIRRKLEELEAYGLVKRSRQGQGKADQWRATPLTPRTVPTISLNQCNV